MLSRESSFLFNNMIFVGIAATVLLLTTFPMLSEAATGRKVTMGPPIFNLVNIPWALALLLLVGIGPLIAWRKATPRATCAVTSSSRACSDCGCLIALLFARRSGLPGGPGGVLRSLGGLDVVGVLDQLRRRSTPPMTFALGAFVMATVVLEFYRGTRVRHHNRGEITWRSPLGRLVWRNKRRYGGYIVHVGVVVIFIGIAASSAYQQEAVRLMQPGEMIAVDNYYMRYERLHLEAVDDHLSTVLEVSVFDRASGELLAVLYPEQRFHPNMLFGDLRDGFLTAKRLGETGSENYTAAVAAVYNRDRPVGAAGGPRGQDAFDRGGHPLLDLSAVALAPR